MNATPRTALLLCDEEEVHDLAEAWLLAAGWHVLSAPNGSSAARRIRDKPIDLLVLDALPIYFPDLPGVRELKEHGHFRVILIPRLGEELERGVARTAGVDVILDRPLRRVTLLSAIGPSR